MTPMLDVAAAREIVLRHAKPLAPRAELLSPDVLGETLAEDVLADIDSPPFDKSMMDGYAVRAADCGSPLKLVGEVQAGAITSTPVQPGEAVRIFTGAPIPPGADAVVKQEDTAVEGEAVRVQKPVKPGANIFRRGSEMRVGEVVVPGGTVLTPVAFGLLAGCGRDRAVLKRTPQPKVAIIATGNELVESTTMPAGGQIRNTNAPMLYALAGRAGGQSCYFGAHGDDRKALETVIGDALYEDLTLIAGGVSVGKYDLVPDVLKSLGVVIHFHTVRMKPGKPLLFGTFQSKLVFGLPGNPVSAAVGFELFVRPAIDIMCGRTDPGPKERRLPLSESLTAKHDRPTYHPAVIGADSVRPLPWQGSADLRALLPANGFVVLPPGEVSYAAGEIVDVILMSHG
jgi:molybdopterin molybdotransferase